MKEKDLSFIAYKNLINSVVKSNSYMLGQILSDSDMLVFKENKDFFIDLLDSLSKKDSSVTNKIIGDYYKTNPEEKSDIDFAKKILERTKNCYDVEKIFNLLGEDNFIKDYVLMNKIINNIGGNFFFERISDKASKDEGLRNVLYSNSNFSLLWFKLEAPNDKNLILDILNKDFNSYRGLNDEQKLDKEITLKAIESVSAARRKSDSYMNIKSQIYEHIPDKLKSDLDVSMGFAKIGFAEQSKEAYMNEGILKTLLGAIFNEEKRPESSTFYKLDYLPLEIFSNYKNINDFLSYIDENIGKFKKNHDTYSSFYKIIKGMAKHNKYVKELFKKPSSVWNVGNITETKNNSWVFFDNFFKKNIKEMKEQYSYFYNAEVLKETLNKKQEPSSKVKIKI